jgi:hypothetical protein
VRLLVLTILLAVGAATAQTDPRYCGQPARAADGSIKRSTYQRSLFVRMHPCPATGQITGACPGWAVDHIIPLACGGCDAPMNMAWMPNAIKSGPGTLPKDRWERRVYCEPAQITPMEASQ